MQSSGAGSSTTTRRSTRVAPSNGAGTGAMPLATLKRKTRSTSVDVDKELTTAKRPALSAAFNAHVSTSSLQRQLLNAQAKATEYQNTILQQQGDIDRLEADRRLLASRLEEQTQAKEKALAESATSRETLSASLSSLKARFNKLEAEYDELSASYGVLRHKETSQASTIAALEMELEVARHEKEEALDRARAERDQAQKMRRSLEDMGIDLEGDVSLDDGAAVIPSSPPSTGDTSGSSFVVGEGDEEHPIQPTLSRVNNWNLAESVSEADADADGESDELPEGHDGEEEDMSFTLPEPGVIRSSQPPSSPPGQDRSDEHSSSPLPRAASETSLLQYPRSQSRTVDDFPSPGPGPVTLATRLSAQSQAKRTQSGTPQSSFRQVDASPSQRYSVTPSRRISASTLHAAQQRAQETAAQAAQDRATIRAELANLTTHLRKLETSNASLTTECTNLRSKADGAGILRERVRELERKLESMDKLRARVGELEGELELRKRQAEERSGASAVGVGVTAQLTSLRSDHADLLDKFGLASAALRSREAELASIQKDWESAVTAQGTLRGEVSRLKDEVTRKEKDRGLLEREVTFLKSLISSYKEEVSLSNIDDPMQSPSATSSYEHQREVEHLKTEVAQLEALLEEYKGTITKLETDVDRLSKKASSSRPEDDPSQGTAREFEEALRAVQGERDTLLERVEGLEQALFELRGEIGAGRHIPPGTRVLMLRENPAQLWANTRQIVLDRLKGENAALLKRLGELEASTIASVSDPDGAGAPAKEASISSTGIPRESWESLKREKEDLEDALKQKEKRLLRLQQVFTAKSTEFREAIASILGLKLAFYPNGQVRVTSMYDLGASFVFQPAKDASSANSELGQTKMQLIGQGEGGPQELEQLMNYWIQQEMCIPCFLASVTLECYDKVRRDRDRLPG